MKVKVSAAFEGTISTGSYQNERPSFIATIETEIPDGLMEGFIDETQKQLHEICINNFKSREQQAIVERVNRERADFRFYLCPKCGVNHPSVTSILNWDSDFFVSPEELQQYASQGNLYDLQAKHFIKTGVWEDPEKIDGSWADIVILKKGSLGLQWGGWDFPAFLKKYPIEQMTVGTPVYSCVHNFAGTPDIPTCVSAGKRTHADIKRTPDKIKHFPQLAGYIIAQEEMGEKPFDQMMLIPANTKTEQGFSRPIVSSDIDQYKAVFLRKRQEFKKRFGI